MRKHKKRRWLRYGVVLCILLLVPTSYFAYRYYEHAMKQRVIENPTTLTKTTSNERYSLQYIMDTTALLPGFHNSTFRAYANEQENGTYIIPGLEATRTLDKDGKISMCTSMTPQGIAVIEDYVLISAYCHTHTHNTVIYVLDKTSHAFIKEVVLPGRPHGGSIAYDHDHKNIWICSRSNGEAQVVSFSMENLKKYALSEYEKPIVYDYQESIKTISSNSFMTYYQGYLYMGYFSESLMGEAEKFKVMDDGTLEEGIDKEYDATHPIAMLSQVAKIPKNVQGITFYKDKLILSVSDGPYVPSALMIYNNAKDVVAFNDKNLYKKIVMPERMEQVYIVGDDMYVLFESASNAYKELSAMPSDRVIKFKLSSIIE